MRVPPGVSSRGKRVLDDIDIRISLDDRLEEPPILVKLVAHQVERARRKVFQRQYYGTKPAGGRCSGRHGCQHGDDNQRRCNEKESASQRRDPPIKFPAGWIMMNCLHICSFCSGLLRLNCLTALTAIQLRAEPGTIPIRVSFIVIAFTTEWGKSSQRSPPTAHETPGRLGLFDSSQLCYSTSLTNDETKPCRPVPNFVIGLSPT
jgi:hypothetical protein